MIRDICNSRIYQLSVQPTPSGRNDQRQFSHARLRRLRADVLLDSIVAVTGIPRSFPNAPAGTKAISYINRNHYYSATGDYVLDTFGQSARETVCACDTKTDPSLSQVMHLLVGDTVGPRVQAAAANGVLKKIIDDNATPEGVIEAIFIQVLARRPTAEELQAMLRLLPDGKPEAVYADIFAGLLDSTEFLFNH
jgi:hypothetical protein